MKIWLFALMLALVFQSCKKDPQPSQVSFTLNGINKSYNIASSAYDSISNFTENGKQELTIHFGTANAYQGVVISLFQVMDLPGSMAFETGTYKNLANDTACGYWGGEAGCHTFLIAYSDSLLSLNNSPLDATGQLQLTSFSTGSNLISGTFACTLADNQGHLYPLTNGRFTNIALYVP